VQKKKRREWRAGGDDAGVGAVGLLLTEAKCPQSAEQKQRGAGPSANFVLSGTGWLVRLRPLGSDDGRLLGVFSFDFWGGMEGGVRTVWMGAAALRVRRIRRDDDEGICTWR